MHDSDPSTTSHAGSSRGLLQGRFSLRWMMVGIAVLAAIFGYLGYFRSARGVVSYQIETIPAKKLDALGLTFRAIKDSPYRWAEVKDFDLTAFAPEDDRIQQPFRAKEREVHMWPYQADSYTDSRFVKVPRGDPPPQGIESTQLGGFWGFRKAGLHLQFRLELQVGHQYPDFSNTPEEHFPKTKMVEGKLFYEGKIPAGDLLFIAPIDNDVYHAILVRARPMDAATNAPTKTAP
ncbi:hypothetical protein DTL21_14390 [Bremerella cremea]|uniref:Uncharacterized protein n=1 Tax=Blastopirellula marina TaxID=124 RepID=A0A2S8FR80_9BACT|nr:MULTISPECIES: hypothetical protein [Pirellulaceae]PQO34689.1 hypothetical protein C5Y83_14385 [Blastopirellula marina]RCS47187.1 hypothetical protein DTL21_14390 [Bremerella cremea]